MYCFFMFWNVYIFYSPEHKCIYEFNSAVVNDLKQLEHIKSNPGKIDNGRCGVSANKMSIWSCKITPDF